MSRVMVILLLLALGVPVHAGQTARPNVLFILLDDLRPELGCYGKEEIKSPHIDALAGQGMLFERAYCQVAVCNPSRASMLSGLRPDTIRIYDQSRYLRAENPEVLTLPQFFKNQGYRTLSVGKVFHHSASEPGDDPLSWSEPMFGFGDNYRHWFTQASEELVKREKARPENKNRKRFRGPPYEASNHPDDDYPDGQTASKAIELLRANRANPFFLAVGFIKPHLPFTSPQAYWDLYPQDSIELPENDSAPAGAPSVALQSGYELRSYGGVPAAGEIPRDMALNLIRGYRACVSFVDAQLGRVLAELDRLGLRENTIVVVVGDHGYHLGENGLWTKMTNFESATRIPLVIRAPGRMSAGKRTHALVEAVDLFPTLVDLCGFSQPGLLEGSSLVPLLKNPERAWKTAAFSQYGRGVTSRYHPEKDPMGYSLCTERYRYTQWRNPSGAMLGVELYDLSVDPDNSVNISKRPENAALVRELSRKLQQGWRAAQPADQSE